MEPIQSSDDESEVGIPLPGVHGLFCSPSPEFAKNVRHCPFNRMIFLKPRARRCLPSLEKCLQNLLYSQKRRVLSIDDNGKWIKLFATQSY